MSLLQYSNKDRENVMKCFGRTLKQVEEYVENLQKWLTKQPHLPEVADKKVIERFLMINKYSVEKVKNVLDAYYTIRSIMPEFYGVNPNHPHIKRNMDIVHCLLLPRLTEELHRICVVKSTGKFSEEFDAIAFIITVVNLGEIRVREDYCVGCIYICDLEGTKIEQLAKFTPMITKKASLATKKIWSSSISQMHIINVPNYLTPFINILKSALGPKLSNRLYLHADVKSVYNYVPKRLLPKEYGGEQESLITLNEKWKKKFEEYNDEFDRISKLQVNDHLRPKEVSDTDLYGIDGNFRQLEID